MQVIARACGYTSPAHSAKTFAAFGLTPSTYRLRAMETPCALESPEADEEYHFAVAGAFPAPGDDMDEQPKTGFSES